MDSPSLDFIHNQIVSQGETSKNVDKDVKGNDKNKKWHEKDVPDNSPKVDMSFKLGSP